MPALSPGRLKPRFLIGEEFGLGGRNSQAVTPEGLAEKVNGIASWFGRWARFPVSVWPVLKTDLALDRSKDGDQRIFAPRIGAGNPTGRCSGDSGAPKPCFSTLNS